MYQLSTDYQELFRLLCEGHTAVGFVDYQSDPERPICRDVCQIRRHGAYKISFGVRGVGYGGVDPWDADRWPNEIEVFVATCKAHNLEFIPAQTTA